MRLAFRTSPVVAVLGLVAGVCLAHYSATAQPVTNLPDAAFSPQNQNVELNGTLIKVNLAQRTILIELASPYDESLPLQISYGPDTSIVRNEDDSTLYHTSADELIQGAHLSIQVSRVPGTLRASRIAIASYY